MNIANLILFIGVFTTAVVGRLAYETNTTGTRISKESSDDTTTMTYTDDSTIFLQNESECVCTPFNLCKTYRSAPNGEELIDIR